MGTMCLKTVVISNEKMSSDSITVLSVCFCEKIMS